MPIPQWFADLLVPHHLSARQLEQLHAHYELLQRWNRRMNLTTVEPGPQQVRRHIQESLFFGEHLPGLATSLADIGSGAGFPGIPLAILQSAWSVTLVESNQRKSVFLREASRDLENVRVLAKRGEEVAETFDWVISRAVNPREVIALVPRLAPRVGLLLGEEDFLALRNWPGIAWKEPVRLPWGDRRICAYGFHVEQRA